MIPHIGYYAHHHGSGHRHRARLVSRAYPGPVDVLSSYRDECVTVPLPLDVADDAELDLGHPATADAHGRLHFAPLRSPHLAPRAEAIIAWVRRARPALVVVDVSVEVALLLRLVGVPVVLVRQHGDRRDDGHTLAYEIATSLLAPYPEWAEDPTATPAVRAKTTYVGGFSRFDGRATPGVDRASDEVVVLTGTGGTALSLEQLQVLAATDDRRWIVLGLDGPSDPRAGLHMLGNVDDPWAHLRRAGAAVVSAGHSALCEAAAAGTPTVALAEHRPFDEQRHKVQVLEDAGAVVAAPPAPPASDPGAWAAAIDRARRTTRWGDFVDHAGAARTADHLVRLASGHTPEPQPTRNRSRTCQQSAATQPTSAAV